MTKCRRRTLAVRRGARGAPACGSHNAVGAQRTLDDCGTVVDNFCIIPAKSSLYSTWNPSHFPRIPNIGEPVLCCFSHLEIERKKSNTDSFSSDERSQQMNEKSKRFLMRGWQFPLLGAFVLSLIFGDVSLARSQQMPLDMSAAIRKAIVTLPN